MRFGMLAERYFPDPDTCLLKLRQLTELLAELVAARTGLASHGMAKSSAHSPGQNPSFPDILAVKRTPG